MPVFLADRPMINEIMKRTRKIKNNTLAIDAAPAAIPPKPNKAATKATTKKITVQRSITLSFNWLKKIVRPAFYISSHLFRHAPGLKFFLLFDTIGMFG